MRTLLLLASVSLVGCALAQDKQEPPKPATIRQPNSIPVSAARQTNPVKPTPESLASGKKWYAIDCALCHGDTGDGKTSNTSNVKMKVSDLTDPATLKNRTDGEIFYIIKNGLGQMPPEGDRVKTEELWDLVNYVRSLAKKPEEKQP
jgi:mono/diheme cytochrome c family protein